MRARAVARSDDLEVKRERPEQVVDGDVVGRDRANDAREATVRQEEPFLVEMVEEIFVCRRRERETAAFGRASKSAVVS